MEIIASTGLKGFHSAYNALLSLSSLNLHVLKAPNHTLTHIKQKIYQFMTPNGTENATTFINRPDASN